MPRSPDTKRSNPYRHQNPFESATKVPKLSVVIPVYNERATIEEVLRRVQDIDIQKEILIIDDGSTDGTRELLRDLADREGIGPTEKSLAAETESQRGRIRVFFQEKNFGKGAALRRGFKESQGQIVIIQDADLEYDPQDYHAMIEPIERGNADVVYGSRFLSGPHRVLLFWHYVGNRILTTLSNMFTNLNLTDVWTCYKAFQREVLENIEIQENRFGFEQEITIKISKGGWRIYEVPISYSGRTYSEGKKITWKDAFSGLWCLLRYSLESARRDSMPIRDIVMDHAVPGASSARSVTASAPEARATIPDRPPPRSVPLWLSPSFVLGTVTLILGVRFFLFIWRHSANLLVFDQWDFLDPFFSGSPGIRELFFEQHGPHREGIGLLVDKVLYPLTHWDVRVDTLTIGVCVFSAMILALVLKRKVIGAFSYSDIAIPMMFLNFLQYEALIGTPNPAYSAFPLLMIVLYCFALLHSNRFIKYSLVLLLNFLLIYTGFGVFMGLVTVGILAVDCYRGLTCRQLGSFALPFASLLIAGVSLGSFFMNYSTVPVTQVVALNANRLLLYPRFISDLFLHFLGADPGSVPTEIFGGAIFLGMVFIFGKHVLELMKRDQAPSGQHLVGTALIGYTLCFSASNAVGRALFGVEQAYSSRYVTLMIPAYLAAYFYLLSRAWRGARALVLGSFVVLMLQSCLRKPYPAINWFTYNKRAWAACYVRTEDIEYCNKLTGFEIHPSPTGTNLKEKLDYLKKHRLNLFAP